MWWSITGDLLLSGVNTATYNVSGGTFSYDSATFTATWTLPQAIGPDKLLLQLNADGSNPIEDESGNRLDGDWTNPTSTSDNRELHSFPSGDGTAGGDFLFRFNVVPGDVDANNGVNLGRLPLWIGQNSGRFPGSGGYDIRYDVDGNGGINLGDALLVRARLGYVLPSAEPVPGTFPSLENVLATTLSTTEV